MTAAKTATLTFRIEPQLKEALRTAAEPEHGSNANVGAGLVQMDSCNRNWARNGVGTGNVPR